MENNNSNPQNEPAQSTPDTKNKQGVDKAPGEDREPVGLLTDKDLKGKKVDADPEKEEDKPVD